VAAEVLSAATREGAVICIWTYSEDDTEQAAGAGKIG
jgi:hypothetical protein